MNTLMECMCLECGISIFMESSIIKLSGPSDTGYELLRDTYCTECGGPMFLVGKAGDEPNYKLK
jgi:hypothetical protein